MAVHRIRLPAAASSGGESAADKAKREELMKKNAEIEAGNKKITEANEIIARTFKAGNEALTAASAASKAKNSEEAIQKYTAAVTSYDEGLAADADQPAILTNKAVALKGRGVERFNATITSKTLDDAGKSAGLQAAKEDFKAAAETAAQGSDDDQGPAGSDRSDRSNTDTTPTSTPRCSRTPNQCGSMSAREIGTQADAGLAAFKDYIAVETDPAKKAKAQIDMAQMLLDAGAADKALTEFKAILAATPDSPEANLGAGLAVYAQWRQSEVSGSGQLPPALRGSRAGLKSDEGRREGDPGGVEGKRERNSGEDQPATAQAPVAHNQLETRDKGRR